LPAQEREISIASIKTGSLEEIDIIIRSDLHLKRQGKVIAEGHTPRSEQTGIAETSPRLEDRRTPLRNIGLRGFVDQDVVLHPDFIADHLSLTKNGIFLQGKRVLLPEYYTMKVLDNGLFNAPDVWLKGLRNRKNLFRIVFLGRLLSRSRKFETSLRGCNFSMFKSDFIKVDGFDEVFDRSWGREDSDICFRLFHSGLRVRSLWFSAPQYHLYHGKVTHWDKERLDGELQRNLEQRRVKAVKGFSKLSGEEEIITYSKD